MRTKLSIFAVLLAVALLGAACGNDPTSEQATEKRERQLGVVNAQDRFEYEQNLKILIEEFDVQTGKLQDYRINIAPSGQATYDARIAEFTKQLSDFKAQFAAFQEKALEEFLIHRATLNSQLTTLSDTHYAILKDYEIDFTKQP